MSEEHQYRLFLALVKIYDNYITPLACQVKCWKSKYHNDGKPMNDEWFILGMTVTKHNFTGPPESYDISYTIPRKYWHLANVIEFRRAPKIDYDSRDVLERLFRL